MDRDQTRTRYLPVRRWVLFVGQMLLMFSLVSPLSAESALSLKEVLDSVRQHFPLVLAAEEERAIAGGQVTTALGEFDVSWKSRVAVVSPGYYDRQVVDSLIQKPTSLQGIDLYGGYRLGRGDFAVYDGKAQTADAGEARLGIQMPLLRNREIDGRRAGLKVAEEGLGIADQDVRAKRIDAVYQASMAYWRWVGAGKKREIVSRLLEVARDRDRGLKGRMALGDIAEFEWKDNLRGVLQRENQLQAAERAMVQTGLELSLYYRGRDGQVVQPSRTRLPREVAFPANGTRPGLEQLERQALANRPELQRMVHERKQAEVQDLHARNQTLPALDLMLEVSKDAGQTDATRAPTELVSGFQLEVPLQRRQAQGRSEVAQAKMRKLDREIEYLKQKIVTEIQDADSALTIARQQVEIVARELEYAEQLEEGERIRFNAGESTIFMVNLREQATADAALRQIDTLIYAHTAEAMLQATLGVS